MSWYWLVLYIFLPIWFFVLLFQIDVLGKRYSGFPTRSCVQVLFANCLVETLSAYPTRIGWVWFSPVGINKNSFLSGWNLMTGLYWHRSLPMNVYGSFNAVEGNSWYSKTISLFMLSAGWNRTSHLLPAAKILIPFPGGLFGGGWICLVCFDYFCLVVLWRIVICLGF